VTARRLSLTAAIVALERGSILQYSMGLFICLSAGCMQTFFNPYCAKPENILAFMVRVQLKVVHFASHLRYLNDLSDLLRSAG